MTVLAVDKPVAQSAPVLLVENKLAPGRHRFALVVVDDRGVASDPAEFVVTVRLGTVRGPLGSVGGGIQAPRRGAQHHQRKGAPR